MVPNMDFIPEQPKHEAETVPFFDDVTSEGGWRGHSTSKTVDTLKSEIMVSISRLGGLVTGWQRGAYLIRGQKREGFRIHYVIEQPDGAMWRGRLDVAALPVKEDYSLRRSYERRKEQSLKMALFMLREALDGTWFLQQLSPGYAPLMPWMLEEKSGKTFTQLWSESMFSTHLLPEPKDDGDIVEAEFREAND